MNTPRGQAAVNRVRELEAELAKKNEIIEKVKTNVMEYPNGGCEEGRIEFLESCGIERPVPDKAKAKAEWVWFGVCLKLTDKGRALALKDPGQVRGMLESVLDDVSEDEDADDSEGGGVFDAGTSYVHEAHFVAEEGATRRRNSEGIAGDHNDPPRVYVPGDWA